MIKATARDSSFEVYPFGEYLLRLSDISEQPKKAEYVQEGEDAYQWKWKFEILEPEEYAGKTLVQWSNRTINPKSTARPWVEALLGRGIEDGEEVVLDDLIDLRMYAQLSDRNKEGEAKNKIVGVRSNKSSKPRTLPNMQAVYTGSTKETPEDIERRYNAAKSLMGWTLGEVKDFIEEIVGLRASFGGLKLEQQRQVVAAMEQRVGEADVPFNEGGDGTFAEPVPDFNEGLDEAGKVLDDAGLLPATRALTSAAKGTAK